MLVLAREAAIESPGVQFEMVILLLQQSPDEHIITPFLEQTASPDESEVSQREHPNVMTILLGADQTSPFIYSAYPISTSDLGTGRGCVRMVLSAAYGILSMNSYH
jgi:hypothetical protein